MAPHPKTRCHPQDSLRPLNRSGDQRFGPRDGATNWMRTKHIRDYVLALIEVREKQGHKLAPNISLGKWALWAMDQADRLDPLTQSPPSVLDRKWELSEQYR
jgi:hypothetical protein